ncbi:unnamed protein product, partial [Mesorhabditis belari]|uniref:SET domain-containing protein n=1 Tax=Mesorhabditis belari TaxID=2138241 RepID=A0AAF3E9S3_9BILA
MGYVRNLLHSYSHRFVPSLFARIAVTELANLPKTLELSTSELNAQLLSIFLRLAKEFPQLNFGQQRLDPDVEKDFKEVLYQELGFELERKESTIKRAGRGVFLKRGFIQAGRVVCVYPGTIYHPGDSIFLPSLGNQFVLRCKDGVFIDGNDSRLSKWVFSSCARRDLGEKTCDETWMSDRPLSFLNLGQYVNNASNTSHNVQYMDLDLQGWPFETRRFLPYVSRGDGGNLMRVVCLVSTTQIAPSQELFSAYIST